MLSHMKPSATSWNALLGETQEISEMKISGICILENEQEESVLMKNTKGEQLQ